MKIGSFKVYNHQMFKDMVRCRKCRCYSNDSNTPPKKKAIKKNFGKKFTIPLDFDFFKHSVYLYRLKENLIVQLELNSFKKVILCSINTAATYKLSDISLK